MATSQPSDVTRYFRRAVLLYDGAGLSDGQLLECFLQRREEAALAALVHRHGAMVWGVCQRVLRNSHDAEDAFQAAFLVLIRKAASITSRELFASWLYKVAYRTALKARAASARRRLKERQVTAMPERDGVPPEHERDWQPLLDEELSRLPDKYRVPIVLCDLEGKTRKQAAQQLRCPEGTVAGRLARARSLLARRLTQRGVALSGGALATMLAQDVGAAAVPAAVVTSTIKAATLVAAGQAAATGAISPQVAALTEGVLKAMLLTKLKTVIAGFVLVSVTGIAALLTYGAVGGAQVEDPRIRRGVLGDKVEVKGVAATRAEALQRLAEVEKQLEKLTRDVRIVREMLNAPESAKLTNVVKPPVREDWTVVLALKHARAAAAVEVLQRVMPRENLRIAADDRTNSVLASGSEQQIRELKAILNKIDIPTKEGPRYEKRP
jgi:RNA polymerase sigma factor (sigma-70 family)